MVIGVCLSHQATITCKLKQALGQVGEHSVLPINCRPEHQACFVDLFTCGKACSMERFEAVLCAFLAPSATYRRVLAAGVLNVVVAAEVSGFAAQEREHIGALERELLLRGANPQPQAPIPPTTAVPLETQADALGLLLAAENMAETAYLGAMAKLQNPGLVRLAAEILASEAQHWTLLRALQTPQDLAGASPVAFVTP